MTKAEELLNKAKEKYAEGERCSKLADSHFESYREYMLEYRTESVNRVLDFIRDEYRAGRICDLEALLCHCQNKLNGNIDGIELDLDGHLRGVPFKKVGENE
jgi:hypothetical protein